MSFARRRALSTRLSIGGAIVAIALIAAGCGGSGSATTTTTSPTTTSGGAGSEAPKLTLAQIRNQYQADSAPANKLFTQFVTAFNPDNVSIQPASFKKAVKKVTTAMSQSAEKIYALRLSASPTVSKDIVNAVSADNTVYQALNQLAAGYGLRSFDINSWVKSFSSAVQKADNSANQLREALGLKAILSGNS